MRYGELPKQLGIIEIDCKEMLFYQYLPIKFPNMTVPVVEKRLECFNNLIGKVCCDFIAEYGLDRYVDSYIYLTAKKKYQTYNCGMNRPGWHSDGFMTDDINYIWSDKDPTIFNTSEYNLTLDDSKSLKDMYAQSLESNNVTFESNEILRLNQYCIHRTSNPTEGYRTFVKISFSKDKYDLLGNSHNYELEYDWEMRTRESSRNVPQLLNNNK